MLLPEHSTAERAQAIRGQIIEWRRTIHANPELSFQEFETARFVADALSQMPGMDVKTGVGSPTAVVGTLTSGSGPSIALRADMDALPIREETNHSFSSNKEGVMHACGHDAHTAILLGAARLLAESFAGGEMSGRVKFIFQPAEEATDEHGSTGAPYLIQAGVLKDIDCVLALHMNPEAPFGEIKMNDGYSMANVDVFRARLYGSGGHGAYPHLGSDPVWMLSNVLPAIYSIVSRQVSPLEPAVISVGHIRAGSTSNVIPSLAEIEGTMRSYDPAVREKLISGLEQAFAITKQLGGDYTLEVTRGEPALQNDKILNQWIAATVRELFPGFAIERKPFGLGGEDFAHMAREVPGAMFFLGCALPDGVKRDLHTPVFDLDERCLPVGASILAETVRRYLRRQYRLGSDLT